MTELIIVEQLPIIKEQLKILGEKIDKQVSEANSLACTEKSKKSVKSTRAELNKTLKELEAKKISVKKEVMAPYDEFEKIYKENVTNKLVPAIGDLKIKIDEIEDIQKKEKIQRATDYFKENNKHDFLRWNDVIKFTIGLSTSAKQWTDAIGWSNTEVQKNLDAISSMAHSIEVLAEYKVCLDFSQSVSTVNDRVARIEAERQRAIKKEEAREEDRLARIEAEKVEEIEEPFELEQNGVVNLQDVNEATPEVQEQFEKWVDDKVTICIEVTLKKVQVQELFATLDFAEYEYKRI
jgi:hypothetical protein